MDGDRLDDGTENKALREETRGSSDGCVSIRDARRGEAQR